MVVRSEVMSHCMVEASDAGDVAESFVHYHMVVRSEVMAYCMGESSDVGDVAESFFIIVWSLFLR